jgi:hypothetical protein
VPIGDELKVDVPLETPPPVVTATAGDVVVAAAGLSVVFTGYTADGAVTEPPSVEVSCTLAPDQTADLATISVSDVDGPGTTAPTPPGAVVVGPGAATPRRSASAKEVQIPADCHVIDPPVEHAAVARYCANVTGFANVAKLHASVLQPMGIVNIGPTNFYACPPAPTLCQQANILANRGEAPVLPEANASLLPFGFVPSTAKMQLTQVDLGFADIKLNPRDPSGVTNNATVTGKFVARLYDATVNGVRLDLGPNCRTATPLEVELHGKPPTYLLTGGGPLAGVVTIPPFTGCGVKEDLDPLITGLVSGDGNAVKLTQGSICTLTGAHGGCPPQEPVPER